jgi:alanine dehydrogenase
MPGAVPRTSTFALTNATLPYALDLANKGFEKAIGEDVGLTEGVNTFGGKLTYEAVATSQNLEYTSLDSLVDGIAAKASN